MPKIVEVKKVGISVTIDPFILELAIEHCQKEHRSMSSYIEHLVAQDLINEKNKEDESK